MRTARRLGAPVRHLFCDGIDSFGSDPESTNGQPDGWGWDWERWRTVACGLVVLASLASLSCHHAPPAVVVLRLHSHEIGAWADDDTVCVALPLNQALYLRQKCVPMRAVRGLILTVQEAN
jgi:hypothetical protein